MEVANLWIFFYNSGAPVPPVATPQVMIIVVDLPELSLAGAMTLGS